jgi:hypothetical protein
MFTSYLSIFTFFIWRLSYINLFGLCWLFGYLQLTRFVCALHINLCFVYFAHLLPFRIFDSVSYIWFRFVYLLPFRKFASVSHILHCFAHSPPFRTSPTLSFMVLCNPFIYGSVYICFWFSPCFVSMQLVSLPLL